jgi:hypothetical protein
MAKSKAKLSDVREQRKNANLHDVRATGMLEHSIRKNGVISAITVAKNLEAFDGSNTLANCLDIFGDEVEPIFVYSDGSKPVVHVRTDIETADDPRAVELGVAANRIPHLDWNPDIQLLIEINEEIDLSDLYFEAELAKLAEQKQEIIDHQEPDFLKFSDNDNLPAYASDRSGGNKQPIPIVVGSRTMQRWNEYKESVGIKNDTAAFEALLDLWTD